MREQAGGVFDGILAASGMTADDLRRLRGEIATLRESLRSAVKGA